MTNGVRWTKEKREAALTMWADGHAAPTIAKALGFAWHGQSVRRVIREARAAGDRRADRDFPTRA